MEKENKITDELRQKLRSPLPPEAVSKHPTKTFLSSIKAIYVEERLNDVFGIGSWTTKVEFVESADTKPDKNGNIYKMVVVKLIFEIPEYNVYHECYGGNDNADLGDAYKGATTDAITKVGSYLEIGLDVFKGKQSGGQNMAQNAPVTNKTTNYNNTDDDNKIWLTDELFEKCAIHFKPDDKPKDLMIRLRKTYKVAKKYESMIEDKLMDLFA